jgi:hypothetical protein
VAAANARAGARHRHPLRPGDALPPGDLFPASRLLTLDGWGHTAIGKSACVDAAVAAYLVAGDLPHVAATCAPDAVPFSPQLGARAAVRPDVPPGLPLW